MQQAFCRSAGWRGWYQSVVHSHTLPIMSYQSVSIRRKRIDRRRALVPVAAEVLPRKLALPGIGHMPALPIEFVTPGVVRAIQTAAGGEFPLRFGRQLLARPFRVRLDIAIGDVYGRVVFETLDRAFRPQRMAHVRSPHELPPGAGTEIHPMARLEEHHRAGIEHLGQGARIIFRSRRDLGKGHVAGGVEETLKISICDRSTVHPEAVHRYLVNGRLLRIVFVRAHAERAARNPDHAGKRRLARLPGGPSPFSTARLFRFSHTMPPRVRVGQLKSEPCLMRQEYTQDSVFSQPAKRRPRPKKSILRFGESV